MEATTTTTAAPEDHLLAALKSLPGVTAVTTTPLGRGLKPNDHGVKWTLNGVKAREACTKADGAKPTLAHAVQAALDKLRATLGAQIVDRAVAHSRGETAFSMEETAWLAEWCEQHAAPETITMEMATAALRTRRSTAGGSSASAVLHEAQLLLAQKNGAEQRVRKAQAQLARAEHALEQREQSKKARVAEPEWRSREYGEWPDRADWWRQEEGRIYNARRQVLLAEKAARPVERRPRGKDGPLDHWRLGLVGAVKYWSNGSKAEAAIYIKSLVDRLQLQAHTQPVARSRWQEAQWNRCSIRTRRRTSGSS